MFKKFISIVTIIIVINNHCVSSHLNSERPSKEYCATKPNEVYIDGGSPCQTYCNDLKAPCLIQTFAPVKNCYCIDGTARLKSNDKCVSINSEECKNEKNEKPCSSSDSNSSDSSSDSE